MYKQYIIKEIRLLIEKYENFFKGSKREIS